MGVGNLQQALMGYGKGIVPYAQLYFDSSPLRHAAAWRKLASLGDDSSTYLWRVLAARDIMRLYRSDPSALEREAVLQSHKASAEEVLHPPERTTVFGDPFAVGRARASGALREINAAVLEPTGCRSTRTWASWRGASTMPRLYRALRPQALAILQAHRSGHAGDRRRRAAGGDQHRARQALPARPRGDRPRGHTAYSLHTTGFAFDIARVYRSRARRWPSSSCSTA